MPSLSALTPPHEAMTASQPHDHCFENRSSPLSRHLIRLDESKEEEEEQGDKELEQTSSATQQQQQPTTTVSQPQRDHCRCHRHPWFHSVIRMVLLLAWISVAVLTVVDAGSEDDIFEDLPLMDNIPPFHPILHTIKPPPKPPSAPLQSPANVTQSMSPQNPFVDLDHVAGDDSPYDPPYQIPGLTHDEFDQTWYGGVDTIKIGVLLPFASNAQFPYMTPISRINLSVLRMAVRDMNDQNVIPGMNLSLVVRDSQQFIPGTNVSGGAAAISATTRILNLGVGGVIGDVPSDLTTAEAIMTSSVGVPQCSFASYNMDTTVLSNFVYLFRTVPGVTKYFESLALVVKHYKWTKVSIIHTSDIPGIISEKAFSAVAGDVEVTRFPIPLPQGKDILETARRVIWNVKNSDTRIHILAAPRAVQIPLLDAIRDIGLFHRDHVWMTAIDLTDSLSRLSNPSDFNGLIMADALWNMPGVPEYDRFVTNWEALNPKDYPMSGSPQLTWHETFAYTCIQVFAEAYRDLVANAMALTNTTARDQLLNDIRLGKRSQDLTMKFLSARNYSTPVGKFTVSKGGEAFKLPISISSFQNSSSMPNGKALGDKLDIFNDVVFNSGSTSPPFDVPSWDDLSPSISSLFGITIVLLTTLLMLAILITAIIVIVFRENIVIKSASPLFCILELFGLAVTLSWIYLRVDQPSEATCRMGLLLIVVGLSINLSALVVKNYRIYRIFNSVSVINHAVSNRYLLRVVTIPVVITLIPCLIRCFYKYLMPTVVRTNENEYWVVCASPDASSFWDIIVGAMPIIINIFGIYLAFKTRNVTRLWNEARSIAITIYLVSFFVIIIIIVQSFPVSLYKVTYHVTLVSVFLASLIEYIILFYPKLRNLFLHRRGLHVAVGRDDDGMDSILGGVSATLGGTAGARLSATTLMDGGGDDGGASRFVERRFGSVAALLGVRNGDGGGGGSAQGSTSSADIQHQQGHNISDLVSSYPFGQLNNDGVALPMIFPVHGPTMYEPSSTLINRGGRKAGAGGSDQEGVIDDIRLSDAHRASGRSTGVNGGGATIASDKATAAAVAGGGGVIPPAKGYDTFVRDLTADIRNNSRDATQPADLHDAPMVSSNTNGRSNDGLLSAVSGGGGRWGQDLLMYDFLGTSAVASVGDDPYSRKSSVVEYDALGMIHRLRTENRSPKLYPLQTNYASCNTGPYGLQSSRHSLKERRTDSYTVTAPVQRQRWYVMRFLAQWRMSKIIFVPYSKLFVMVDLETEKSESLIVHTIEKGYSTSDYWTTTEEAQHIDTTIYPTDGLMAPASLNGGAQLPPIKSLHLSPQQQQQQQQGGRSTLSPLAHPTALPGADVVTGRGQAHIKPVLSSNQDHPNILTSPLSLNPNTSNSHSSNSDMNQELRPQLTGLTAPGPPYQMSENTVLMPLDDGFLKSPPSSSAPAQPTATSAGGTMSPLRNILAEGGTGGSGSGNTTMVDSLGSGVGVAAAGTGSEAGAVTNTNRVTIAPGATGGAASAGSGSGRRSGVVGDVEEGGSSGASRRRIGSISGFNSGVRRMSQYLGFPARNSVDPSNNGMGAGGGREGRSTEVDDTQPATNGIKPGVISEHIIRVISIHNEVWRVQLPDQDTMDRWIEIGQQIKDENWISRPFTVREGLGDTSGKKSGGGNGGGTTTKRGSSSSGDGSGTRGGGGEANESSPEDKYEFAQRPPRRPAQQMMQQMMQQRSSSFHPLQTVPTVMTSTSLGAGSHLGHQHLLHQPEPTVTTSSYLSGNNPLKRHDPIRFDSDTTETSYVTSSSQGTERKQIREQAARINQEMRATTHYVPPLFRGLLKQQRQQQQSPSATNSPRLSANDGSFLGPPGSGSPRPNSLGHRFRNIPSSLSMAPISSAGQRRFGVIPQTSSCLQGDQQQGPLSVPPVTPSRHHLSESFLPTPSSPSSPTATTPEVSGTDHRSSEETNIRDILTETNVSYDHGQHAVYEGPLPGHEHRNYRHFNTLQYNYDAHLNNNSKSSSSSAAAAAAAAAAPAAAITNARRRRALMKQRRRRSGGTVGSVGTGTSFNEADDEDLDLNLELELDFEYLVNNHHRAMAAESSPESPQWHMTSVELVKMEAENLKRNGLASGGSDGGYGLMPGGGGGGGGADDNRSTGSGGSCASAASAHTTSAPTHFVFTATTSSSAPAPTFPTPKSLTLTGDPPGNLNRPPLGGTRFSRFSPGVPAVSSSDVTMTTTRPDQEEFPWQQQTSTPLTNPAIIYSPPPPEPGDDDYQSPEHEQDNSHPRDDVSSSSSSK